ncbi:MAG: serine/threonine-protein kinase [Phycisphaerae bacterium]
MGSHDTITLSRSTDVHTPAVDVTVPRELGPVRLLREIGRGGMGVVYVGRHQMLDRDVAVKFLLNAVAGSDDPGFARFLEGARAAARLEHPGLTTIHHADVVDGIPYLVMQYIDGPALSDVLKRTGPLSLPALFAVLDAVSQAIGALHDREIVHRDIKPSNMLLDWEGQVFVTDFGLACSRPLGQRGEPSAGLAGTPAYMAPEMFEETISPRSDVYALGITAFELLTGDLPFTGTLEELRQKHLHEPLPLDPLRRRQVDAAIIEVLERAAHKNAMFRYKTAEHFGKALKAVITTDELLREGVAELQKLRTRSVDKESDAATTEAPGHTPTSTYFDRLSEMADEKRATRELPDEEDAPKPTQDDRAQAPTVSPDDRPVGLGSIPDPPSAEPARAAALVADVPCAKCDYNLRGLAAGGGCPECGEAVASSLRPDRLLFANPKWLSTIALGQALIFATMIAIPIFPVVALVVFSMLRLSGVEFLHLMRLLMSVFGAIAGGGIATGVFMSTRREPALAAPKRTPVTARIARVCALVGIPGIFAGTTVSSSSGAVSGPSTTLIPLGEFVLPIGLAACVIGGLSLLLYLRKLAERVPDAKLLRSSRQLATLLCALVPLGLGSLALSARFPPATAFPETRLMFWLKTAIVGIPAVLTAATVLLYWCLMVAYRRSMKRVIAVAVSYDTLFGDIPTKTVLPCAEHGITDGAEL